MPLRGNVCVCVHVVLTCAVSVCLCVCSAADAAGARPDGPGGAQGAHLVHDAPHVRPPPVAAAARRADRLEDQRGLHPREHGVGGDRPDGDDDTARRCLVTARRRGLSHCGDGLPDTEYTHTGLESIFFILSSRRDVSSLAEPL